MQFAWAVVGAKVQYIGPAVLHMWRGDVFHGAMPAPLKPNIVYTIKSVEEADDRKQVPYRHGIALRIQGVEDRRFGVALFRPIQDKDAEVFSNMLEDIPADLRVTEQVDLFLGELEKAWANG